MATIKNIIETQFTAKGARQTAAETDNVTKAQTRLGNTSTNNARQFSAQSQGLGGLVAAYAGAAATTFALQQAFSALQKAAQFNQIIEGTNAFSSAFGVAGDQVISSVQKITKGQLSIVEAATAANLALSAGFNLEQLESLTDVATKASRALGRDLQDSFNRVVRGSAKLEPELLDELGIFTRIEPAVEAYAAKLNKSASSLSNFERRQAFVNAVIEEGQRKFSVIDTSNATAAQSFSRLSATITDFALKIGSVLAEGIAPLADYISGNLSSTFGAFGIILGLVSSKLNQVTKEGLNNFTSKISEASDKLSTGLLGTSKKSAAALGDLSKGVKDFNLSLGTGLGPLKERRNELIKIAKTEQLNFNQARELNSILKKSIATEKAAIDSKKALQKSQMAAGYTSIALNKEIIRLTASLAQNEAAATKTAAAIARQGVIAKVASAGILIFGRAVQFVGSAFNKLLTAINIFTIVLSVLGLIGPYILKLFGLANAFDTLLEKLGSLGKAILGIDDASKKADKGVAAIASSLTEAAFKAGELTDKAEGFVKTSFLGIFSVDVKINADTIRKDVQNALDEAFKAAADAEKILANRRSNPRAAASTLTPEAAFALKINKQIADVQKELNKDQSIEARVLLQAKKAALEEALKTTREQRDVLGETVFYTGVSGKLLDQQFEINKQGLAVARAYSAELKVQFITQREIAKLKGKDRADADALNKISAKQLATNSNLIQFSEQLASGRLTLEAIAKSQNDLLAAEVSIQKEITTLLEKGGKYAAERVAAKEAELDKSQKERERLNEIANTQSSILRIRNEITKSFSSEIAAADKIKGLINEQGNIAKNSTEEFRNRLKVLSDTVKTGNTLSKLFEDTVFIKEKERLIDEGMREEEAKRVSLQNIYGEEEAGTILQAIEAGNTAKKATIGLAIKAYQEAIKLTDEYKKQAIALKRQNSIERINIVKEVISIEAERLSLQERLNQLQIQGEQASLDRAQRANDLAQDRASILRKAAEDEIKSQQGGVLGGLFTDKRKRELEIKFREGDLAALQQQVAAQTAIAKQRSDIEVRAANAADKATQRQLDLKELTLAAEEQIAIINLQSKQEELNLREKQFKEQSNLVKEQLIASAKLPKEMADVFSSFLVDFAVVLAAAGLDKTGAGVTAAQDRERARNIVSTEKLEKQIKAVTTTFNAASGRYSAAIEDSRKVLAQQTDATIANTTAKIENIQLERDSSLETRRQAISAAQAKYNEAVKEGENKLLAATKALETLKTEAERANNSLLILAVKATESLVSNFEKSFDALINAINDGTLTLENFKQGFKDFIRSILIDIQKAALQEAIVKPVKEFVFGTVLDALTGKKAGQAAALESFAGGKQQAEAITQKLDNVTKAFGDVTKVYIVGQAQPVQVVVVSGTAIPTPSGLGGAAPAGTGLPGQPFTPPKPAGFFDQLFGPSITAADIQDAYAGADLAGLTGEAADRYVNNALTGIPDKAVEVGDAFGTISESGTSLGGDLLSLGSIAQTAGAGLGALIGGALGGGPVGSLVGSIAGSVLTKVALTAFGLSSGGLVSQHGAIARMAAGGPVHHFAGGGMQRDRVPALLEPGEFVMRKSAVDSIGSTAMERMNATGKSTPSNISVQVQNEGTPKETQQQDVQFDAEAAVIKIIMKDMRNNGPIRKSIRSSM